MRKLTGAAAMVVLAVGVLAGCSASESGSRSAATQAQGSSESAASLVATYPRSSVGMDALIRGTLQVKSGCVGVTGSDGSFTVLVFPDGDASWSDGELSWAGSVLHEGDAVSFGGGLGDAEAIEYLPAGCEPSTLWLVSPEG